MSLTCTSIGVCSVESLAITSINYYYYFRTIITKRCTHSNSSELNKYRNLFRNRNNIDTNLRNVKGNLFRVAVLEVAEYISARTSGIQMFPGLLADLAVRVTLKLADDITVSTLPPREVNQDGSLTAVGLASAETHLSTRLQLCPWKRWSYWQGRVHL